MQNENYEKDFKPFLIWLIAFMIGMNGFPMLVKVLLEMTSAMQTKLSIILLLVALLALYYIVYRGESVYFLPGGPTFREAKEAGSERRKAYAKKCLGGMLKACALTVLFLVISMFLGLAGLYDWIVAGACIGAVIVAGSKDRPEYFMMKKEEESQEEVKEENAEE